MSMTSNPALSTAAFPKLTLIALVAWYYFKKGRWKEVKV